MAIKYIISGPVHLQNKAKAQRDSAFKPKLIGLKKCEFCGGDTTISFVQHTAYAGSGSVDSRIDACCQDFHELINEKLGKNR